MSWCTYFSAEQIAEALVWDCCSEFPNARAHSLPCVLHADLLSEESTVVWRRAMGALAAGGKRGLSLPLFFCLSTGQIAATALLIQLHCSGLLLLGEEQTLCTLCQMATQKSVWEIENTSGNYFPSQHPKYQRWNLLKRISETSDTSYSVWLVLFLH